MPSQGATVAAAAADDVVGATLNLCITQTRTATEKTELTLTSNRGVKKMQKIFQKYTQEKS